MFLNPSIKQSIDGQIGQRIIEHRNKFHNLFLARYCELLPFLITYTGTQNLDIDILKLELGLRSNLEVVVGEDYQGRIRVIGYIDGNNDFSWDKQFTQYERGRAYKDITFLIPPEERAIDYKEITDKDSCSSGNFVTIKNKLLNYTNDYQIIQYYTDELSEIVVSRYSLAMQAKITTFFIGEEGDTGIDKLVSDLYNGKPFIKVNKYFDKEESIHTFDNANLSGNFVELKREYQNKVSELNNMLGINSLAVEKASGVSDTEAKSNRAYTQSNANIYIDSRNRSLKKLNKRYNLEVTAIYNDLVSSELSILADIYDGVEDGNDNNDIRLHSET